MQGFYRSNAIGRLPFLSLAKVRLIPPPPESVRTAGITQTSKLLTFSRIDSFLVSIVVGLRHEDKENEGLSYPSFPSPRLAHKRLLCGLKSFRWTIRLI